MIGRRQFITINTGRRRATSRREFITLLGGAAAPCVVSWPLAARAQSGMKSHRVSFLALIPREDATLMQAFLERLHELGYSEGANLIFEYRSAEGQPERLDLLAAELVRAKPDVLVAGFGTLAAKAAKGATTTIPIVFTTVGDPLGAGIIANIARPGGNVTGLTDQARDVQGKRLQLLLDVVFAQERHCRLAEPGHAVLATRAGRSQDCRRPCAYQPQGARSAQRRPDHREDRRCRQSGSARSPDP
jgi:putative tryptophan/tyrosine transport system substrate-binding protein